MEDKIKKETGFLFLFLTANRSASRGKYSRSCRPLMMTLPVPVAQTFTRAFALFRVPSLHKYNKILQIRGQACYG